MEAQVGQSGTNAYLTVAKEIARMNSDAVSEAV
jgi:hypothetical protein